MAAPVCATKEGAVNSFWKLLAVANLVIGILAVSAGFRLLGYLELGFAVGILVWKF